MHEELLKKYEEKIKKIPEIIGLYYTGSTAKGTMDKYSDIDTYLVVRDKDFEKVCKRLVNLAKIFGKVKFHYFEGRSALSAFVGNSYLKVEVVPIKKSWLKPAYWLKNIRVVKDTDNFLANLKKRSQKFKIEVSKDKATNFFLQMRDSQIYTARHVARGWKWSAMGEANYHGEQLFYFLAKLHGKEQFGFREAETFLNKKELKMLTATRCCSTKIEEIKRAMAANWKFMKYIEKKYEEIIKTKLNLGCNDKEILKIVDKTYSEAR